MTIFEMPIKDTYIPDWGAWECLREAMQNGLDEQDNGYPLTIKYRKPWLKIYNQGADLDIKALILGYTTKADNPMLRGQHGEGLALSFLAGLRSGIPIKVETQNEVWTPSIAYSDNYQARILTIKTRKLRNRRTGVTTYLQLLPEAWEELQKMFVFLRKPSEKEVVRTDRGDILLDQDSKGMLFAKGIFVQRRADLVYGYDLKNVKLDRDRRIIDAWDLKWELGKIYSEAVRSSPKIIIDRLYNLLKEHAEDVRGMDGYNTSEDLRTQVIEKFKAEHGETAVPVNDMQESKDMLHLNRKGVVVNDALRKILEVGGIESVYELQSSLKYKPKVIYSWDELDFEEQQVLERAAHLIDTGLKWIDIERCDRFMIQSTWPRNEGNILDNLQVVDFHDQKTEGVYTSEDRKISIAKRSLTDLARCLRVLIHEKAHAEQNKWGGEEQRFSEELWTIIFAANNL